LDSGRGAWKLENSEGAQHLELEFHELSTADKGSLGSYGFPLMVSRGWSTINLRYFLGDPDEGNEVEFSKR